MARLAGLRRLLFAGFMVGSLHAGSIEGRVTNAVTGEPVVDATVRFLSHGHPLTTATDSNGAYQLTDLADGDYQGQFSKDGFSEALAGSLESIVNGAGVAHVAGNTAAHVDAQLRPWGGLRGRVVDEEGKPAAGVHVEISRGVDNDAMTDADGAFAFQEVEPASYTVVAKPAPVTKMRDGERVGSVPVYYPSATELVDAVSIPVKWGADVAGIEIKLKDVPVHRVSGMVVDSDGKPLAHVAVRLLGRPGPRQYLAPGPNVGRSDPTPLRPPPGLPPSQLLSWMMQTMGSAGSAAGPGPEPEIAKVESGEDGSFAFDAVTAGEWRVSALTDEFGWKPTKGVVSTAVGDKDVEGLEIRLSAPIFIDVSVDWGDDKAHSPETMVNLSAMEGPSPMLFDPSGPPPTVWPVLPGRYRVAGVQTREPGYYVSSVTLGGVEVLGQVVDLEPGAGPFRVTFKHDAGSVRGKAEKGEGATAFLVSREAGDLVRVRKATCGADGAFEFRSVPPGDYYAVVFDRAPADRFGNALPAADLPESIVPMASSVRVEAGSEANVEVRVNSWAW